MDFLTDGKIFSMQTNDTSQMERKVHDSMNLTEGNLELALRSNFHDEAVILAKNFLIQKLSRMDFTDGKEENMKILQKNAAILNIPLYTFFQAIEIFNNVVQNTVTVSTIKLYKTHQYAYF